MAIESMAMGEAGATVIVMVGVGCGRYGVDLAGMSMYYSYVGICIVGIFLTRRENRLTHKAVKVSLENKFHVKFEYFYYTSYIGIYSTV